MDESCSGTLTCGEGQRFGELWGAVHTSPKRLRDSTPKHANVSECCSKRIRAGISRKTDSSELRDCKHWVLPLGAPARARSRQAEATAASPTAAARNARESA